MSEEHGDQACWLDSVCERCGALIERDKEHRCRRPVSADRRLDNPADDGSA